DVQPRASEEIPKMVEIVASLLEREAAYVADGWVYFQVSAFPGYGQLSKHDREEMLQLSAERGADPEDGRKRDPLDFVLWQPSLPDEPSWPSPWGHGRPGWHLECSAMSIRYLGDSIDIHGGGADLLYPHHESEIAQSELFTGSRPFARFWLHNGMVSYNGQKMSKSLGNLVLAHDILQRHSATAVRLYFSSFPYRQGWEFVEADMQPFDELAEQYAAAAKPAKNRPLAPDDPFLAALDDDLDAPGALSVLEERLAAALAGDGGAAEELSVYGEILGLAPAEPD
ncbi:MAG: class I tRNA ligase family protein, partial [Chloroflexota bacterium]|nr:class I tRNA ligase family protein [Chloroflexota bacterium]